MLYAGVDIGSTTSKCVLLDDGGFEKSFARIMTEFNRDQSGEKALNAALEQAEASINDVAYTVATGYGRKAFLRADENTPEIIAHAKGTYHLVPEARTIIDIGGQDSKVISMDEDGIVKQFAMNDKCAAGTGRFFEVLTHRLLGIEMDHFSDLILQADSPIEISSMCTIFAETEIISHLSQNASIANIAAGTAYSIARRIISSGKSSRVPYKDLIVFSGGPANNEGIRKIFEDLLGKKVIAVTRPQCTAAYGAALMALEHRA